MRRRQKRRRAGGTRQVFIVCPARREKSHKFYTVTKNLFLDQGFKTESVSRLEGWDLAAPIHQHRTKSGFLLDYFVDAFVPRVFEMFLADEDLEVVLWAEVGGDVKKGLCATALRARRARPSFGQKGLRAR